jgi:hypothetical protein
MRLLVLMMAVALAGCADRRDFDERFDDTANEIADRANTIDHELNSAQPGSPPRDERKP